MLKKGLEGFFPSELAGVLENLLALTLVKTWIIQEASDYEPCLIEGVNKETTLMLELLQEGVRAGNTDERSPRGSTLKQFERAEVKTVLLEENCIVHVHSNAVMGLQVRECFLSQYFSLKGHAGECLLVLIQAGTITEHGQGQSFPRAGGKQGSYAMQFVKRSMVDEVGPALLALAWQSFHDVRNEENLAGSARFQEFS